MLHTLIASAALMGLAGTPHCLAMCGAASAAACALARPRAAEPGPAAATNGTGRDGEAMGPRTRAAAAMVAHPAPLARALVALRQAWPFHLGRLLSYAAAGAVAAASMGLLAQVGQAVAALRPLWTLVHLGALVLGLYLLWHGRQPAWMEGLGRVRAGGSPSAEPPGAATVAAAVVGAGAGAGQGACAGAAPAAASARMPAGWAVLQGPRSAAATATPRVHGGGGQAGRPPRWRLGLAGAAWVAWPCGLLQSALLVAALADGPAGGAAVMAAFAATSAAGLLLGPAAWSWLLQGASGATRARWRRLADPRAVVRAAGLMLALASAWALGHGMWLRVWAWCLA